MIDRIVLRIPAIAVAALVAVTCVPPAAAASRAGDVRFASGSASVTRADGSSSPLSRGLELRNGDTVDSGSGRVQLRFTDGALVSLQPESRFRIDDYRFDGRTDGTEKGFFSLLKGGLRTISGWIGRVHRAGYRVDTPTATIGIRGTEYTAVLGNSLTVSVAEGRIAIVNDAGEFLLDAGRTAYVKDRATLPVIISEKPFLPPAGAQPALASFQPQPYAAGDDLEGQVLTALAALREAGVSFAPGTLPQADDTGGAPPVLGGGTLPPILPPDPGAPPAGGGNPPGGGTPPPGGGTTAADYLILAGAALPKGGGGNDDDDDDDGVGGQVGALFDAGKAAALKCGAAGDCTQLDTASFKLTPGSAKIVDNGFDGIVGWGRWTGGKYNNTSTQFGNTTLLDTEGLHYVYGAVTAQLPKTDLKGNSIGTYSVAGATSATSVGGKLGLGAFGGALTDSRLLGGRAAPGTVMVVDFSNPAVELGFKVDFKSARQSYTVTTNGPVAIKGPEFGLAGPQLGTTGCASSPCTAKVQGFFAGPNAERAGIGYQIDDGVTVNGAAALKQN